jgi:phytoene synthase
MGRVYLPEDWLRAEGLSSDPKTLMELRNREALVRVVARVLDLAEHFYRSGNSGIRFLNFRSALAVSAASAVYRQIGRGVRRRGASAWETRTVVPPAWKRWALLGAVLRQGFALPLRWFRPWRRASLQGQVLQFSPEG